MSNKIKCSRCNIFQTNPLKYMYAHRNNIVENKVCDDCMSRSTKEHRYKCSGCDKKKLGKEYTFEMRTGFLTPLCSWCRNPNREDATMHREAKINYINVIERNCLRCDKPFNAENKFMRSCNNCKTNKYKPNMDMWE